MPAVRTTALAIMALATTGCAFRSQVSGMAVEYNEFVAEATNRQTVINILRARSREPLHFTSFSKVLGTARIEGTAGLDLAANGNGGEQLPQGGAFSTSRRTLGATNWTPKLGVKINSGTDFEIGINATDDFWKGITTPVSPATIVHLLRQDWPRDLISYLFIQRVEFAGRITDPAGKVVATLPLGFFRNAPDNEPSVDPFTSLIRCRTLDYSLSDASPGEAAGEAPSSGKFAIALSERRSQDFGKTGRNEDCVALERSLREAFAQELERRGLNLLETDQPETGANAANQDPFRGTANYLAGPRELASGGMASPPNGAGFTASGYFRDLVPEGYKTELLIDVSLRSVEQLIYFLGEYVRTSNKRPMIWGRCADGSYGECIPLLVIKPADEAGGVAPFITVDYRGERYIVPSTGEDIRAQGGLSSQVIGLVQTMLNLHRSSKDLPSTPLVRVIN
jgi:hypothetical protein